MRVVRRGRSSVLHPVVVLQGQETVRQTQEEEEEEEVR